VACEGRVGVSGYARAMRVVVGYARAMRLVVGMRGPCGWWWVCVGHAGGSGYTRAMRLVVGMRGLCRCWWHTETSTRTPDMIIKRYVILT
jgi:hypothetical protein